MNRNFLPLFALVLFGIQAHADTDYQGCNQFLSQAGFQGQVTIDQNGALQIDEKLLPTIVHSSPIMNPDGTIDHYEILISHQKNPRPGPPPYLDNRISYWLGAKQRIARIEQTNNYAGNTWNGSSFEFDYDGGRDQCQIKADRAIVDDVNTGSRIKNKTLYITQACVDLLGVMKSRPQVLSCFHEIGFAPPGQKRDCLGTNERSEVQTIFDTDLKWEDLVVPPDAVSLSEKIRFYLFTCELNGRAKLAVQIAQPVPAQGSGTVGSKNPPPAD